MKKTSIALALALSSITASQSLSSNIEGQWFLHKFGELRSYHGDFLNVCSGAEFKFCRTVQYGFDQRPEERFFGDTRLSIADQRSADGTSKSYTIEIFINSLPDKPTGPFIFSIDGEIFAPQAGQVVSGSPEGYNVSQTFSITDPALTAKMIAAMRKGNSLRVLHDGYRETRFQLRGISSALDANDIQMNGR
ncbi:MAG: hypothetical protein ABJO57_01625 [Lentilitoribacter sp.]